MPRRRFCVANKLFFACGCCLLRSEILIEFLIQFAFAACIAPVDDSFYILAIDSNIPRIPDRLIKGTCPRSLDSNNLHIPFSRGYVLIIYRSASISSVSGMRDRRMIKNERSRLDCSSKLQSVNVVSAGALAQQAQCKSRVSSRARA